MARGETTLGRVALTGLVIAALTAIATAAGATVVPNLVTPSTSPSSEAATPPIVVPRPSASPSATVDPSVTPSTTPTAGPDRPNPFAGWAKRLAEPLDIPHNVLAAYAYAEFVMTQTRPACKLQWTTIAAIGKVSSDHGRVEGRTIDARGWPRPTALVGPPLDGTSGRAKVTDTDGGAHDGDKVWDRTMGPMQLIPSMWRASGVDGDSDGLANPQDIDDAALAAAYHLCTANKDLSVVDNWKAAVNSYHGMAPLIDRVFEAAQAYGVQSKNRLP